MFKRTCRDELRRNHGLSPEADEHWQDPDRNWQDPDKNRRDPDKSSRILTRGVGDWEGMLDKTSVSYVSVGLPELSVARVTQSVIASAHAEDTSEGASPPFLDGRAGVREWCGTCCLGLRDFRG